jgi:V/A-type H+-transporting ATPase subunit I
VAAVGVSATLFGFAYGEAFGPTGLVPPGLIKPIDQPVEMLLLGVAFGAVLLAGAYLLGIVNRFREGGWPLALYAPAGVAGALVFAGAGAGVSAVYWRSGWVGLLAAVLAAAGITLAFVGLFVNAGGRAAGAAQAGIETFDLVIRLGANIVSFARLAAFGLTHAVLSLIVWRATTGLWHLGPPGAVAAVPAFVIGNALAFGLEALVAGIQALRLEYYELFSRVFQTEGRPFRPWHVPTEHPPTEPATGTR